MLIEAVGIVTVAILLVVAGGLVAVGIFSTAFVVGTALIDWADGRWL